MKANEFVNKYGWDKARLLLSTQGKTIESLKDEYTSSQLKEFQRYIVSDRLMNLDKLKRLIESYELVGSLGGIDYCKCMVQLSGHDYLKQVIADVESCQ